MAAPLRILMVDDDPADRAVVERDLRRGLPNAAIEWAPDAASLARALEAGGFDVAVTDFVLAWTNGLSVLRDVKARHPECPVIMYTSTGSEMIAVEGMMAGLDDYVVKSSPHGARLPAAVQAAIDRARSRAVAREAEARYRSLFLGVPVGLFRATPECRLLDANPAFRQMLALPAEGPVTEVDLRALFVDPAEGERWVAMFSTTGMVKGLEASLRRRDGTVIWVRGSGRAVRDAQGNMQLCEGEFEDITKSREAWEALRKNRERLALALSAARLGTWDFDLRSRRFSEHQSTVGLFGLPPGKTVDTEEDFFKAVHPDDRERVARAMARAVEEESLLEVEYRVVWPDGSVHWLLGVGRSTRDADGNPAVFSGVGMDITQRRLAEDGLRVSEAELRSLVAAMTDVIILLDADGRYLKIVSNDASRLILPPADLLGKTLREVFPREKADLFLQDIRTVLSAHKPLMRDISLQVGGEERWVVATLSPAGEGKVLLVARDITERRRTEQALRESEEKYRKLVETANDAIFLADAETGAILDANPRAETLLGRTRQEIVGLHQSALHPPDTEAMARQTFEEHVRIGPATTSRLMAQHKSGRRIPVDISTAVLELGGRRVIQGIFRDVSERRHLEEQLRHTQKIEAIGRLAGGVAHDFNNLLSAIIGFGQLAFMKMEASNPLRRYLDEVLKAADRGTSLTRQLLSFSRKQVHEPVEIDLNEVVKDMDRMLCRLVGEDVVFQVRLEPRLGRMRADRGQLEQVVMNLVVNARDAMPQGGTLTLETTNEKMDAVAARRFIDGRPGDYVSLRVTDTGHGMDVETRAHLFEPFFTTKDYGTGLGLSTIYGIVRQGGGQIDVDSERGRGSTFRILFPRVEPETAPASNRLLSDVVPSGTETVLVVEDEEAVRTMVREILSVKGYTVLDAGNGNEALDLAERHPGPIHLVLTDVVMTGPGGPEVADRLRARRPDVKVLFMSGYPDVALLRKGGKGILRDLLPKPFTPDVLARRVREAIDQP
jgi:two-component system cell cycle sensor histidine kinase/response regulator CckA